MKESLERKFRVVAVGATVFTSTGALVYLLNREASPVTAAEPPTPSDVEADPAFLNHLGGEYSNVRIVREPIELEGCTDTDRNQLYPDGINPWEKGTACTVLRNGNKLCVNDGCWDKNVLFEYYCGAGTGYGDIPGQIIGYVTYRCRANGAVCQDGRCVHEVLLPLVMK